MRGLPGLSAPTHNRGRGSAAEKAALRWLRRQGYRPLARNVVTRAGEIDLVAAEAETLCFIEIKARSGGRYGPAIAAVDRRKQRRLARAAALFLTRRPHSGPCRFDVLGIDAAGDGWRFTLIRDAFQA